MTYTIVIIVTILLVLSAWTNAKINTEPESIILTTAASTEDSGLLDCILPAVGTGKALQMGCDGESDVLLVHAKSRFFVSRSSDSGTHKKELVMWLRKGIALDDKGYTSAG